MFIGAPHVDDAYKEAITTDGEPLSRGHMNPSRINSFDINFMKATFTFTNAVPQFEATNSGRWQEFDTRIRNYAQNIYVRFLTGRSENGLIDPLGKPPPMPNRKDKFLEGTVKLETPRAVWTAGCCEWKEPGKWFGRFWKTTKAESFAVMSNNQKNKTKLYQTQVSVDDLEKLLRPPSSAVDVNLFPGYKDCRSIAKNITNTPTM